jgi:hypothetical protein
MAVLQYQNAIHLRDAFNLVKTLKPLSFEMIEEDSLTKALHSLSKMI